MFLSFQEFIRDKCWWRNFEIGDNFWMLLPDAIVKGWRILVTKLAKIVTNISKLSPKNPSPTSIKLSPSVTLMLVTDFGYELCWWQKSDVVDRSNLLEKSTNKTKKVAYKCCHQDFKSVNIVKSLAKLSHMIFLPGVCSMTGCLRPVRGYPDFDNKNEFPSLISNRMQLKFHVPNSVWDVEWILILLLVV